MDYENRLSLDIPLRTFVRVLWNNLNQQGKKSQGNKEAVFKILLKTGCDYYELLSLYMDFPLTESDGEMLVEYAPAPTYIFPITQSNVRLALPHWTPSKYHTAPLTEVVDEIQRDLLSGHPIAKVYNSNLNPKNRRAYNDRYILLITAHKSIVVDINRRTIVQFQQNP